MLKVQIVWFKRDLRIADHAPLYRAAERGLILPIFVVEPDYWTEKDSSGRQYEFLSENIADLDNALRKLGGQIFIKRGNVRDVFIEISKNYEIEAIFAHQETHNNWTYQRDKEIRNWARMQGIRIYEYQQNGVIRGLKNRNGWAKAWDRQMRQPCLPPPQKITVPADFVSDDMPPAHVLGLQDSCPERAMGGATEADRLLNRFLTVSGENYRAEMSSPVTAPHSCSRISPHLAWGSLSIKTAFQKSEAQKKLLMHGQDNGLSPQRRKHFRQSITSFQSRLHWHCHFMQKLEDEPSLEWQNAHSAYDGIRPFDAEKCQLWLDGLTGYPLIDAVMRCLKQTGWINFRMRAMVMSFASYHLWLDWRQTAPALARLFIDYEPGIHYSQAQMQSGTTGINTLRIYNPIKQSQEQDPEGQFIRRYIPELSDFPLHLVHTPWILEHRLNGYPMPVIDEEIGRRKAADIMHAIRKNGRHSYEANQIQNKHGSRKSGLPQTARKRPSAKDKTTQQLDLF